MGELNYKELVDEIGPIFVKVMVENDELKKLNLTLRKIRDDNGLSSHTMRSFTELTRGFDDPVGRVKKRIELAEDHVNKMEVKHGKSTSSVT